MKKKPSPSAALKKAREEHEKFLIKSGASLKQVRARKASRPKSKFKLSFQGTSDSYYEGTGHGMDEYADKSQACVDNSIMANLHKEPAHVRAEILKKAAMCEPSYNKGGMQYNPSNIRIYGQK